MTQCQMHTLLLFPVPKSIMMCCSIESQLSQSISLCI